MRNLRTEILSLAGALAFALTPAATLAADNAMDAGPMPPNDAQITQIVVTSNNVDIDAAKVAEKKSQNSEVKSFAQMMITDHSKSNEKTNALAKKLAIKPEGHDTAKEMRHEYDQKMASLKSKSGKAFDKAYIEYQVAFHEEVLDALDRKLVPNARNPELKALLDEKRPVTAMHLDHAKKIQAALEKEVAVK